MDYISFQNLICEKLPVWVEVFTSAYYKEDGYTEYERKLWYWQTISSSVFAGWIADIQKDIECLFSNGSCSIAELYC